MLFPFSHHKALLIFRTKVRKPTPDFPTSTSSKGQTHWHQPVPTAHVGEALLNLPHGLPRGYTHDTKRFALDLSERGGAQVVKLLNLGVPPSQKISAHQVRRVPFPTQLSSLSLLTKRQKQQLLEATQRPHPRLATSHVRFNKR